MAESTEQKYKLVLVRTQNGLVKIPLTEPELKEYMTENLGRSPCTCNVEICLRNLPLPLHHTKIHLFHLK